MKIYFTFAGISGMKNILVLVFLFQLRLIPGQVTLSGTVVDAGTKERLPFVNIGIKNRSVGATSFSDGTFSLSVSPDYKHDTITFSLVGYSDLRVPVLGLGSISKRVFEMKEKTVNLKEVTVSSKKLVEKKYGIKKYAPAFHIIDASINQNDIFEIAQLMRLENTLSKVTSVNLFVNNSAGDSGIFRINFYAYAGGLPSRRLVEKNIVRTCATKEGWLKFDLEKENIFLKGDVVVAIEFIPRKNRNNSVKYEVKLGGRSKSFVRKSSLGAWQVPPHHYRMFITALSGSRAAENDDEEKDTEPAFTLFSKQVNDSFSVFVGLPKSYKSQPGKKYPVVYLLDGNVFFDEVYSSLLQQPPGREAILVGIGYKNVFIADSLRQRDYTYPGALAEDSFPVSGGAAKFFDFLGAQLLPLIDKTYRTEPGNRTLMGHSLGGYFTLYALLNGLNTPAPLFLNYVAVSPSLDYCGDHLVKQFVTTTAETKSKGFIFLSAGSGDEIKQFSAVSVALGGANFKSMTVRTQFYKDFGHMDTAIPGFLVGLNLR
jgi:predicted alpha/beta superfamily hydrolase